MDCVFCEIVARRAPARIRYEDDDTIVFENVLGWTPVMLLVCPKQHLTQAEAWTTLIGKLGPLAVEMGEKYCPRGFRIVSNFGADAEQSQPHAHLHVLGGRFLGYYIDGQRGPSFWR
jgi:histidine triad (HIT) family protein